MVNAPGGSFIPKRSTGKVTPVRAGRRIYVFSYVAYVLFFGTMLSVVGIYFLNNQANQQLAEHIILLDAERQKFRQSQLNDVRAFEMQLRLAGEILDKHAAPSRIFDELEPVIVQSVQLNTFSYTRDDMGDVILSLGGITDSFDILMFQREVIRNSALLSSADFTQVSYGAATNEIRGAQREEVQSTVSLPESSLTKVTFTFQDDTVAERIGYVPRTGLAPVNTQDSFEEVIDQEFPEDNEPLSEADVNSETS